MFLNASIQAYYNAIRPTGASDWTLRSRASVPVRLTDIGSQYLIQAVGFQWRVFRRQQDLQGHPASERPGGEILVFHRLRQPDALNARHAAALSPRW